MYVFHHEGHEGKESEIREVIFLFTIPCLLIFVRSRGQSSGSGDGSKEII